MQRSPIRLEIAQSWDGAAIPDAARIHLELWVEDGWLTVSVDAPSHGDPPPPGPAGPVDGLWEYEVVEVFIAGPATDYLEIELGPHGHHLVIQLSDIRVPSATCLPIEYDAEISGDRWTGRARIPMHLLPPSPHKINATAIHGIGASRRYLSLCTLPGAAPDFHQPARFQIQVALI